LIRKLSEDTKKKGRMIGMKEEIKGLVDNLKVDTKAKESLMKTYTIVNSGIEAIRNNHPVLLVTAGEGCGFTSYGMAYREIVDAAERKVCSGEGTFIDLVFPKENEKAEQLFYASPKEVARIRNRFTGTMLISLEEFKGQDLMNSDSLERLMSFISENKINTHFLIRILPDFTAKNQLIARLRDVVNVAEVNLDKPDLEMGYKYVLSELEASGCLVEKSAKSDLKNKVLKNLISGKTYTGYRSFNGLVNKLIYEAAIETENDRIVINKKIINNMANSLSEEQEVSGREPVRIGFRT